MVNMHLDREMILRGSRAIDGTAMFSIIFRDGLKASVQKNAMVLRSSCFQPLAETCDNEVRFEATGGENRLALLEYFGTGTIDAPEIKERDGLREDLEAWAIPVSAWPNDLRLDNLEEQRRAERHRSTAYQMNWVKAAVADCVAIVRASQDWQTKMYLVPKAGRFGVEKGTSFEARVIRASSGLLEAPAINEAALTCIGQELSQYLHMTVGTTRIYGDVTVWPRKRKNRDDRSPTK